MKIRIKNFDIKIVKLLIVLSFCFNSCLNKFDLNESNLAGKWKIVFLETKNKSNTNEVLSADSIRKEISIESFKIILETIQSIELSLQNDGIFKLNDLGYLYVDTIIPIKLNGKWKYSRQNQLLILQPTNNLQKKFKIKILSKNKIELTDIDKKSNTLFFKKTVWEKEYK